MRRGWSTGQEVPGRRFEGEGKDPGLDKKFKQDNIKERGGGEMKGDGVLDKKFQEDDLCTFLSYINTPLHHSLCTPVSIACTAPPPSVTNLRTCWVPMVPKRQHQDSTDRSSSRE